MKHAAHSGRIWLVFVGLALVGFGVVGRILYIQNIEGDKWVKRGEQFSTSVRTIEPARGQILAQDGSLLATSVPVYDLRWDAKCEGMRRNRNSNNSNKKQQPQQQKQQQQ